MKMAAAAGNGDDQDRIEGSTAHDPADGNVSCYFESLIFPSQSSAHAGEYRTSELRGVSPPGATCAEGGVAVHRGDAKWNCPD